MPSNITTSFIEDIRNILANLSMNISESVIISDNLENQTDILNSTELVVPNINIVDEVSELDNAIPEGGSDVNPEEEIQELEADDEIPELETDDDMPELDIPNYQNEITSILGLQYNINFSEPITNYIRIAIPEQGGGVPQVLGNLSVLNSQSNFINIIRNTINTLNGEIISKEYYIDKYMDTNISISKIYYSTPGGEKKEFWVPTYVSLDYNSFLKKILSNINLTTILENRDISKVCSYYILTGNMEPEVERYYDEFNGIKKTPIQEGELEKLNVVEVDVSNFTSDHTCSICCEPFMESSQDKKIIKLDCGDIFCSNCIIRWLKEYSNKCPNCNKVLDNSESEEKIDNAGGRANEHLEVDINYQIAYFIYRYAAFYRRRQNLLVNKINLITELFISQNGCMVMKDCIQLYN